MDRRRRITRAARSDGAPDRLGLASRGIFLAASPGDSPTKEWPLLRRQLRRREQRSFWLCESPTLSHALGFHKSIPKGIPLTAPFRANTHLVVSAKRRRY